MGLFRKKTDLIYSTPPTSGRRKQYIIIILIILAVPAVWLLTGHKTKILQGTDPLRKLGNDFTAAIISGDTKTSYSFLSPRAKSADSQLSWQARLVSLKNFYSSVEYKSTKEIQKSAADSDGQAILFYEAKSKKNEAYTFRIIVTEKYKGANYVDLFGVVPGAYDAKN